jgi:hypothetical protein
MVDAVVGLAVAQFLWLPVKANDNKGLTFFALLYTYAIYQYRSSIWL